MKCEHGRVIRVLYWPADRDFMTYGQGVRLQVVGCNLCHHLDFVEMDEIDPDRRRVWGPIMQDEEMPEGWE